MNPNTQFERDLEQWLQTEAPASAPAGFHASVMDRARTLRQRPGWVTSLPVRRFGRGRGLTLFAVAALLLVGGALAAGSGFLRLPSVVPPVPAPSVGVVATASPDATSPSPSASAAPSPGPQRDPSRPIIWTEASLKADWPVPVREEPAGGATVLQIRHRDITPNAASDDGLIRVGPIPWIRQATPDPMSTLGLTFDGWSSAEARPGIGSYRMRLRRDVPPPDGGPQRSCGSRMAWSWTPMATACRIGDTAIDNVPLDTDRGDPEPYRVVAYRPPHGADRLRGRRPHHTRYGGGPVFYLGRM